MPPTLCPSRHASLAETVLHLLFDQTQHANVCIRHVALSKITDLVTDEFIKFRGALLVYVLAAMVDTDRSCSELASELLLKQKVKNPLLMRGSLLECPFLLNNFTDLEHLRMYQGADVTTKSPLAGAKRRLDRQYVYRFMVGQVDTIDCYVYFSNVRMMMQMLRSKPDVMRKPSGLAAMRDFLYVLTFICRTKEKSKRKVADGASVAANGADDDELAAVAVPSGRGGARRNVAYTMEQAVLVVEKSLPEIAEMSAILCEMDASFADDVEQMGHAISEHFAAMTHYAQPSMFWKQFQKRSTERSRAAPANPSDAPTAAVAGPSSGAAGTRKSNTSRRRDESSSSDDDDVIDRTGNKSGGSRTPARRQQSNTDDTFARPDSRTSTSAQYSAAARRRRQSHIPVASTRGDSRPSRSSSNSQSESDSDIFRRATRLERKRPV